VAGHGHNADPDFRVVVADGVGAGAVVIGLRRCGSPDLRIRVRSLTTLASTAVTAGHVRLDVESRCRALRVA